VISRSDFVIQDLSLLGSVEWSSEGSRISGVVNYRVGIQLSFIEPTVSSRKLCR
jgi:hypothetical protein